MKVASISPTEADPAAEYEVGYGKPPRHAGFQKGRSGNPKGRPKGSKNFATLLAEALDEKVSLTEDGRRRRITKRELVIKQLVNKSASADLRAIKQLTDIVQGVERQTGALQALPSPPAFTAADEEVIAELRKRMERDIRAKIAAEQTQAAPVVTPADPRDGPQRHASFETAAEPVLGPAGGRTRGRLPQDEDIS
jgi:hypothetical protein